MSKRSTKAVATKIKAEAVEPTAIEAPMYQWAASILNDSEPRFTITEVEQSFLAEGYDDIVPAMVEAFLTAAQGEDDVRKGAMFIRRYVDQLHIEALGQYGSVLSFPVASGFKFNAMPKGKFNPLPAL